ncbi:MAG: pilus assembly protein [Candidatus Accumulibacter sp.]|uniref:FimV/HubP family polar landmark protein n=1 Tax=Accumulibacter sp. TaxID=2053492 RepID=UPI001A40DD88|nr:FimV/HubP family polar landmark protein [Accumulibacter sp.]MBL8393804.1 pilus assembly protein [Accumulibacter sp.]
MAKKLNHTARNFRLRTSVWAVASSLALATWPLSGEAAGLGKITVFSALGQPLRAELEVFATREELAGIKAQIASQDAFKQAGVDYTSTASGITLSLDRRPNGQTFIRLSSARPVNDPFVDLLLELNWPTGRLLREYTFLLDPPEFAAKDAAPPTITRPFATPGPLAETRPPEERQARAPRSRVAEQRSTAVSGGATYEVRRGETLSQIARELRPEGVSLEQMLLGLFRANPEAFEQGNINRLKAGQILSVPDKTALEAIPRSEARTVVVAQSTDWSTYRKKLGAAAAETPGRDEGGRQQAAGKITTKVEERGGSTAEPKDQLKVSRTELPETKPSTAGKRGDEDLIAKEKALKDANERLATLERNVAELQRLLELKSQTLADLEKQSAGKSGTAPPAIATTPTPPAALPAPAAATMPAPAAAAGTSLPAAPAPTAQPVEAKPPEAAVPAEPQPAPAPPPAEAPPPVAAAPAPTEPPAPKPVMPPPPPEEPGFLDELLDNAAPLGGGAAIIALLAGYWYVKRRRQGDVETPLDATSSTLAPVADSLAAKSVFRSTGGQSVDTSHSLGQTDFSQAGPGSIDTDEVDPVAEADVYMAYGRDAQAEEILLEAKQKDSRRHAIHLKLLEIYLARKDAKPFVALASELFAATGGSGPDWEKAVAMGLQIEPRNPLFAPAKASEPPPPIAQATVVEHTESFEDTFTKPGQLTQMVEAVGVPAVSPAQAAPAEQPQTVSLADLDFDLGGSDGSALISPDIGEAALETTLAFANTGSGSALDFDLETSLPKAPALASPSIEERGDEVRLVDDESSLEVTMLVHPALPSGGPSPQAPGDFEFDLAEPSTDDATWEEKTLTRAEAATEVLDIGTATGAEALEFDVRLTESTVLGEGMQHPAFDMSSISLDLTQADVLTAGATPTIGGALDFSFEGEQEDTLVNPGFTEEQTDTEVNPLFGETTETSGESDISSSEEVATKLELARAYQDMGDLEGARELLHEVVNEGDAAQREAALALLSGLRE